MWARYYIEHTLHDLYHWAERFGVTWVDLKVQEGNSVLRWTRADRNGFGLMTQLIGGYRDAGGEIVSETEITGLRRDGGRVVGLDGRNVRTGESIAVTAKSVIATTGGFNSNLDMVLEHNPDLKGHRILEGSGRGSTGTGHKFVRDAGGYLTHMDHIWFYVYATPDYRDPTQRRGLVFRMVPGNIYVNQQGRRFHNEALSGGNSATPALMAQRPRHAWAIMDSPMSATMEIADPYYRDKDKIVRAKVIELLDNSPYIRKADTLAGLAAKMEVDAATFMATVERYNAACGQGLAREPEFGKPLKASKAFDTPPYYAVQIFPLARKNFGGVKTDLQCRVLDKHFEPIAGLFAAGEVAGMAGGHINGARRTRRHHARSFVVQRPRRRRPGCAGGRSRRGVCREGESRVIGWSPRRQPTVRRNTARGYAGRSRWSATRSWRSGTRSSTLCMVWLASPNSITGQ